MADDSDIPRALVKRIARGKLSQLGGAPGREVQVGKDAVLALSEVARLFVHYVTATGNDICKEAKRQIISADDVLAALEDIDFADLLPPLRESLEGFRAENKEKVKRRAAQQKKRKLDSAASQAQEGQQDSGQLPPPEAGTL